MGQPIFSSTRRPKGYKSKYVGMEGDGDVGADLSTDGMDLDKIQESLEYKKTAVLLEHVDESTQTVMMYFINLVSLIIVMLLYYGLVIIIFITLLIHLYDYNYNYEQWAEDYFVTELVKQREQEQQLHNANLAAGNMDHNHHLFDAEFRSSSQLEMD